MPTLELTENELVVHMNLWETLAALQKTIRVPLSSVRGATDDAGFSSASLGLRLPGTAVPGLIYAGTFIKGGDRQFAFMTRKTQPVVIELANERWARIILGVDDPRATAAQINAAADRR
ncbi:hypothetical protein [Pseudoduganella sp. GCM10020061]|uniref:hypothetical protein n=1 Tax=Pseudoduganella sp. GCM10020061 TaxID=3317345 RepID=UPI00363259AC